MANLGRALWLSAPRVTAASLLLWVLLNVPPAPSGEAQERPDWRREGGRSGEAGWTEWISTGGVKALYLGDVGKGRGPWAPGLVDRNRLPTRYVGTTPLENNLATPIN